MILKLDTLFCFFIFSVYADINITTKDNVNHFLQPYRLDIHNSTSIYFKVKSCNRVSIGLLEKGTNVKYIVNSGKTHLTIQKYPYDILPLSSVASWSGMNCSCYISLWISWLDRQIAIGKGTMIGTDICNKLTISSTTDINVADIYLKSFSAAYWLFDFSQNATAACTTDGPCGGEEFDPETINTTEITSPVFIPTTINTIYTTSPEFNPSTISTIETRTPRVHPTSNSTTATTTPGFKLTSMNILEITTSGFSQETKVTNAPKKVSSTETTRPGYNPTTTSTTETSPAFNPTTMGSPETTTQGFDSTSVGTIITLATKTSGTTKHIETTSTKIPCICSCNNFTLTEDELITKIALLKAELSVDPKLTNKYKRSLISASDDRPSSKYIGTFGIVILVVICTLIVLVDFQHYARFIFNKQK